ncbi:MAG: ChbG/HpnK family deacetylase [Candidatus Marinimicrobia bacterium]|nr:ChbG/HpnK family deacetylase [Candidatus Neomarinimicrobiota bacterium]
MKYLWLILLVALHMTVNAQPNTAELLGYDSDAKLLIVNADDFGMCHAENQATADLLLNGHITSATIMTPCPWFEEVVAFNEEHPGLDLGVHLTLNSEWKRMKWGSVAPAGSVSSLLNSDGYFFDSVLSVEQNAVKEEVRIEFEAQIQKALDAGIEPTHLDNHMGSAYGLATGNHFLDIIFELSAKYDLPFRLPRNLSEERSKNLNQEQQQMMSDMIADLVQKGFVLPDYLITVEHGETEEETFEAYKQLFDDLKPGVTELYIHAALPTDEIKALSSVWDHRAHDYNIFMSDETKAYLDSQNIQLIEWRELQELQKKNQSG